jgi:hypothetical protein
MIKANPKPTTYKILLEPSAPSEPVSGKSFQATLPKRTKGQEYRDDDFAWRKAVHGQA